MKKVIPVILIITAVMIVGIVAVFNSSDTWEEHYDLGVKYLSEEKYEEAVVEFTAAIDIDSKQSDTYLGRAEVYAHLGKKEKAIEDFQHAIDLRPDTPEIYEKISDICMILKDFELAAKYLEHGIEITGSEELEKLLNEMSEDILKKELEKISQKTVSTEEFLTSDGSSGELITYDFPGTVYGLSRGVFIDADKDGKKELITVSVAKDKVNPRIEFSQFQVDAGRLSKREYKEQYYVGYCNALDVMLYYSPNLESYCIAIFDFPTMSAAGGTSFYAKLYMITSKGIELYKEWAYWSDLSDGLERIERELKAVDWPYAESLVLSFKNNESLKTCRWMLKTDVRVVWPDFSGSAAVTSRYMKFRSARELATIPESL